MTSHCHQDTRYFTRAVGLWYTLESRCNKDSTFVRKFPTYEYCVNSFNGFQHFAEWCQGQIGYTNRESNGKFWQLDKDILIRGNKIYSPDTCVFIPNKINSLLLSCKASRGNLPVGITVDKRMGYRAQVCVGDGKRSVACFKTVEDAFMWYKIRKEEHIKDVASKYRDFVDKRVYDALLEFRVSIDD